ncbi:MAG: ABC transporter ATP-binding protein [Parvularcula sp.]|jgi:fluoroquinolone transport system ATP-binding protein|nr:ABC transporter ATP-binding protein [Parvularcula sp.]
MNNMIALEDVSFTYPAAAGPILDSLSLVVQPGECFGLLGPSGAGKSTVQKILLGLLRGYRGSASVFGRPPGRGGPRYYERVGVSFELPASYLRLTAEENLKIFAAMYSTKTMEPLEALRLVGLDDVASQRVGTFSKGMKMRLNLARSILHEPELLFFDEPTSGQDPARAQITRALITSLKAQGRTIFLTTHDMAEAEQVCDRIGFLVGGRIAEEGTPAELKRRYGKPSLLVTTEEPEGEREHQFDMHRLADNQDFLTLLRSNRVSAMHTQEANLNDVFVAVAGRLH